MASAHGAWDSRGAWCPHFSHQTPRVCCCRTVGKFMSSRVSAWFVDMKGHLDRVTIQGVIRGISRSLRVLICELGTPGRPPAPGCCERKRRMCGKRCVNCPTPWSWAATHFGEECEQPHRVHARQPIPTNPGFGGGDPGPLSSVPYCLWKSRPGEFLGQVQADGACPTGAPLDMNPVCSAIQKVSDVQWVNLCSPARGG